jgi:RNA polymerase sigma-70 factor, ECF subfamily
MLFASKADPLKEVESVRASEGQPHRNELNDIVRAALQGNASSVRQFLSEIAPLVRTTCQGVMGRHNPDLEDVIQDCLVDVVRALPRFRFESDATHYATKITLRRAIAARQRARTRSAKLATMDAPDLSIAWGDTRTEARADLIRNLLDELNQEQAKVLCLHLILGHSISEIAYITGVSLNTVKTRLRLGKIQLRRQLERSGEAPSARR